MLLAWENGAMQARARAWVDVWVAGTCFERMLLFQSLG